MFSTMSGINCSAEGCKEQMLNINTKSENPTVMGNKVKKFTRLGLTSPSG